ncbi:hypothetical protein JGU66_27350 [Myxococcaceae bacterium JPH2]|nr:hypothetical protein [Myxococcaceae bacterium JPH2]
MSMHEIEDMIEGAVRVLDRRAPTGDLSPRSQFARLLKLQGEFDCSFTHFRVMDILLARRFTYRFDVDEHPDHAARGPYLRDLREFTFLHDNPRDDTDEGDDERSAVAGYIEPPHLYCDAGSSLWRRMVEAGKLTGPDAEPPVPLPLIDVVHEVMRAAEAEGDLELIAMLFGLGPSTLFADTHTRLIRKGEHVGKNPFTGKDLYAPEDVVARGRITVEALEAEPRAARLRELVQRTQALATPLAYDSRPSEELLECSPINAWWWKGL